MNKPLAVVSCPIDTYSGYGARARDFVKALINTDKYEVTILSQRWGNTRFGYLKDHNETDLLSKIVDKVTGQPEVWFQITVPNEFQPVGKYNIGVTAGMETTLVHPTWLEGCNRMDLVLTSSEHSKHTFATSAYEKKDKKTDKVLKNFKLEKPMEVLLEGVDQTKYFTTKSSLDLSSIEEEFCFLFVGHWLQGDLGHDRKNVGLLIKSFLETFKNKLKQPALILKTSITGSSIMDQDFLTKKIDTIRSTVKGKLPNIYIVHGDLSDEDMNQLYNSTKVKAMVSLTKGEGFGRPLLEFTMTGKPVIASGWSGQKDFLSKDCSILIGGELESVHKSASVKDMILTDAQWFKPSEQEIATAFKEVYKHYKKYSVLGKKQRHFSRSNFSFENMQSILDEHLTKYVPDFPNKVELTMPKLNLPKLQTI
jgi:glycosyltransferase involved in cell wall biosynthesis